MPGLEMPGLDAWAGIPLADALVQRGELLWRRKSWPGFGWCVSRGLGLGLRRVRLAVRERVSDSGRLRRELRALLGDRPRDGAALDRLCVGVMSALPIDGAVISVTTGAAVRAYSGASDPVCAHLDDLQFTLGEGPCWRAVRYGRPALVGDLSGQAGERWPMFTPAVLAAGFRAIFAFPLQIGAIRLGTLGLFCLRPGLLDGEALDDALIVADLAALTLLDTAAGDPSFAADSPLAGSLDDVGVYRAEVHQATGMAMAQLGVSAQEALVRLRAHAFGAGLTVDEIAREIVARRLRMDGGLSG